MTALNLSAVISVDLANFLDSLAYQPRAFHADLVITLAINLLTLLIC